MLTQVRWLADERADRMVQLVTIGVVAWALLLALELLAAVLLNSWPGERNLAVRLAFPLFIPALVALLLRGMRDTVSWSSWALFAVVTVPVLTALPFSGGTFAVNAAFVGCLLLVLVRPPWSLLWFAAVIAFADVAAMVWFRMPGPASSQASYHRLETAGYDTVAIVWRGIALAMLIWLVRILRNLQAARRQLATRALVIERQRIDAEVVRTIGAALEQIASRGESAAGLATADLEAAAGELRAITACSRAALADARTMLTGYRSVSVEAELAAATTLLAAAGIRAKVLLPDGELPAELSAPLRAKLRAAIAAALVDTRDYEFVLDRAGPGDLDIRLHACLEPAREGTK